MGYGILKFKVAAANVLFFLSLLPFVVIALRKEFSELRSWGDLSWMETPAHGLPWPSLTRDLDKRPPEKNPQNYKTGLTLQYKQIMEWMSW